MDAENPPIGDVSRNQSVASAHAAGVPPQIPQPGGMQPGMPPPPAAPKNFLDESSMQDNPYEDSIFIADK